VRQTSWDGVRAFFGGIGFVVGKPSTWGWAIVPVVVLVTLAGTLCTLGFFGADHLAGRWVSGTDDLAQAARIALTGLLTLAAIAGGLLVALTLAQPLSGFALEAIVRKQDAELGLPAWPKLPVVRAMGHTLGATTLGLLVWFVVFSILWLGTLLVPPLAIVTVPLKFLISALLVAWDLLDYPFGLRGIGVGERLSFCVRNFSAVLSFGVLGALVMLTPGLGVLLLPFGAAGAARLVAAASPQKSA
jgi:CysZ protein